MKHHIHTINRGHKLRHTLQVRTSLNQFAGTVWATMLICLFLLSASTSFAQGIPRESVEESSKDLARAAVYNVSAGVNAPRTVARGEDGEVQFDRSGDTVYQAVARDGYGNAQGTQYDLAAEGAFKGQTILVLHLYTGGGFNFEYPRIALKEKGFSVVRYRNRPPSPEQLSKDLDSACQLWIISDATSKLNAEHVSMIKTYFDRGYGVYIWGDNQPYYADANKVAQALFGGSMAGDTMGDQPVGIQTDKSSPGIREGHDVTTGLETVYEGVTIATIAEHGDLTPLIYGSDGNLVSAAYEKDGKRAILDGGFTRLYNKWETAGTDRFVKNAAAWLVNVDNYELSGVEVAEPFESQNPPTEVASYGADFKWSDVLGMSSSLAGPWWVLYSSWLLMNG